MIKHRIFKGIILFILISFFAVTTTACNQKTDDIADKGEVNVYNWGDYIDESVLKDFEKETGIKVNYDIFATNEDMYVKLKSGASNYDLAIPSDYMIKRMIDENLVQKIDFSNISNYNLIDENQKNMVFDPKNEYSVPYMWGTVGILYNKTMVSGKIDSWGVLWDPKYKKQIFMTDSQRDCIGIALKYLGYSLNSKNINELEQAKKKLLEQKPLVLAYVGDEVKDKMINGEAAMATVWSGDGIYCVKENPDLAYVMPKEGTNLWLDSMVITKNAKNKTNAEKFINFMCRTEIALKNAEFISYNSPQVEVVKKLPKDITENKQYYPGKDDLKKSEVFLNIGDMTKTYDKIWTEVKAD